MLGILANRPYRHLFAAHEALAIAQPPDLGSMRRPRLERRRPLQRHRGQRAEPGAERLTLPRVEGDHEREIGNPERDQCGRHGVGGRGVPAQDRAAVHP